MNTSPSTNGQKKPSEQNTGFWMSIKLAWELGYLIAIPVVVLGFGGAYADKYFGTSPLFLLIGFVLAATISVISVKRRVQEIFKNPS